MNVRSIRALRAVAKRIPPLSSYEARIAELTATVTHLTGEVHDARAQTEVVRTAVQTPPEPAQSPTHSLFVPPGHFYSPIPSVEEVAVQREQLFDLDPTKIQGVDLRIAEQWTFAESLQPNVERSAFAQTEEEAGTLGRRYWSSNPAFAAGDGLFLTLMLQSFKPQKMVELGCGFSSACTLDTRDLWLEGKPDLTFVDPYPQLLQTLIRDADRASVRVLEARSQDLDLDNLTSMTAGDVLFVDSTHISKTGSDVNAVLFDLLPALPAGAVVHIHDMFPGFEYPEKWVMEGRGVERVVHGASVPSVQLRFRDSALAVAARSARPCSLLRDVPTRGRQRRRVAVATSSSGLRGHPDELAAGVPRYQGRHHVSRPN